MNRDLRKWLQISLVNLLIVAFIGTVMRYKIAWSLPWVDQRNLLHAHSHFAFAGWITQALMTLLVAYLFERGATAAFRKYRAVLYANLITAYGMLLTFPFVGYSWSSIIFSTLSIFVSYWFAIKYWRDLKRLNIRSSTHKWFKAAVVFNVVSSLGAFALAYMLATKSINSTSYLASVYFFLHFQYNGWFFFACMGLLSHQLNKYGVTEHKLKTVYLLFLSACVPAYFLSALWLPIPKYIYLLVVAAVFLQLAGWLMILQSVRATLLTIKQNISTFPRVLFILCGTALTIKLILQAGSVIPSLSQLAFGFRPIVIGYLHLVLLGVITLFIIAYIVDHKFIHVNALTKIGVITFTCGIIINELLLMIQGVADMDYEPVPLINQFLLIAALILFAGLLLINFGQRFSGYDLAHKDEGNN